MRHFANQKFNAITLRSKLYRSLLIIFSLFCLAGCSIVGFHQKPTYIHPSLAEGKASFKAKKYTQAYCQLLPRAVRGNAYAQYAIGYMYYYGKGMDRNEELAECWLHKAAKSGQADAIALLKGKK
jgi:hypothetical protein